MYLPSICTTVCPCFYHSYCLLQHISFFAARLCPSVRQSIHPSVCRGIELCEKAQLHVSTWQLIVSNICCPRIYNLHLSGSPSVNLSCHLFVPCWFLGFSVSAMSVTETIAFQRFLQMSRISFLNAKFTKYREAIKTHRCLVVFFSTRHLAICED